LAEDGGAEADRGGAFFDGYGEVVGHAHGEVGEGWVEGLVLVAEAAQMLEVGAGGFGVGVEGWDGHQAADFEVLERLEGGEKGGEVFGGEAVLGVFGGKFDFDEDGEDFVEGLGGDVEAFCGLEGVEGVDGVEDFGGLVGLVVLEGADEVGLRGRREALRGWRGILLGSEDIGEERKFCLPLLDAVFAEEALARGVGFEDGLGGVHLADGHEGDGRRIAVGASAGVGDIEAQALKVRGDGHGRAPVYVRWMGMPLGS
jgi:hypothetical protein